MNKLQEKELGFSVEPVLKEKGLNVKYAIFSVKNNPNGRSKGLKKHISKIIDSLNIDNLLQSPIIVEYKKLQAEAGIQEPVAPAEYLLDLIKNSGRLPNISRIVDCYNIVSAETLLSMGAHDLTKIEGDLRLKTTNGTEKYLPLFAQEPEKVNPNEFATMDDEKIVCRLDLKQCDQTKVDKDTKEFIVYVQGNKETDEKYLTESLQKVCDNIASFCEGEYQIGEIQDYVSDGISNITP